MELRNLGLLTFFDTTNSVFMKNKTGKRCKIVEFQSKNKAARKVCLDNHVFLSGTYTLKRTKQQGKSSNVQFLISFYDSSRFWVVFPKGKFHSFGIIHHQTPRAQLLCDEISSS